MATIDIKKFISCDASILELHGRCWYSDEKDGVPCRIKVGPRRFLNERVHPEKLKLVLWRVRNGQVTYLPAEPVETTLDKNGTLFIDAVALAKKYCGDNISFYSSQDWKWDKSRPWSDSFLTTDYGLATSRSTWLDINWTHSGLYLTPGTLNLCGHDVQNIFWSSFEDECGAHSMTMRSLTETVLDEPHTLTAEDFQKAVADVEVIQEYGINRLRICTDRGDYSIDSSLDAHITVTLRDDPEVISGYRLARRCRPLQQVDILLQMMQATSAAEVRAVLENNHRLGLVSKAKP